VRVWGKVGVLCGSTLKMRLNILIFIFLFGVGILQKYIIQLFLSPRLIRLEIFLQSMKRIVLLERKNKRKVIQRGFLDGKSLFLE